MFLWPVSGQAVDGVIYETGSKEGQILVTKGGIKGQLLYCHKANERFESDGPS